MKSVSKQMLVKMYENYKEKKQSENHFNITNSKLYEEALKDLATDDLTPIKIPFKQYYTLKTATIIDNAHEVFQTFEDIIQYMKKTNDICSLIEGLNKSKHLEYLTSYYAIKVQTLTDVIFKLIHHIYLLNDKKNNARKIINILKDLNDLNSFNIVNELEKLKENNNEIRKFRNEYAHENDFFDVSLIVMKLLENNPESISNELELNNLISSDITFRVEEIKAQTKTTYEIICIIMDNLYPIYKEIMEGKRKGEKVYIPQDIHVSKGFKINILEKSKI